jgi:hypothetical protein
VLAACRGNDLQVVEDQVSPVGALAVECVRVQGLVGAARRVAGRPVVAGRGLLQQRQDARRGGRRAVAKESVVVAGRWRCHGEG